MSQPSPELFFRTVNAFQATAAIKAAVELELFTAIAEGNNTAQTIAARCQASERGARILCDYLVVLGFLTKQDGQFGLTPDSALFLDKRSPAYLGGATEFLLDPMMMAGQNDILGAVRKGGTTISEEGSVSPENPVWVKFARAMMPMMVPAAQGMAALVQTDPNRKVKLLDIAAGHGIFGITFAHGRPNLEVTALDWASVLEVAKENAQKFGVADQYRWLPGSAFEVDFGDGYDVILLTNFLHHFDAATNENLLKKIHKALADDGRVVTLEFVPNDDRVTPPMHATFAMTMLASTAAGDAFTFAELQQMFSNAGFSSSELHDVPPAFRVVISHK
ncbi:MAG TPA: class I SAM-dependent methyltransferase [Blastocatellia bacterium]|nr:class I SAM-dependent methyltransferase [Blastocatellia bacterium]HMV87285.1 class I SAM-dependent methyltransferase [Blastocatellia bacterium]HMX28724.1 class I SAM-dependent methyltransferase [Blastocatellia bacterium]HMY72588.1 class I SAM-dependent methyltransferase [Blastocatellia bacterium]HMZ22072.1 class I SAM-dependent methyltransferase [Blastocatellia bacterium]